MNYLEVFNETEEDLQKEIDILKDLLGQALNKEQLSQVEFNVILVDNKKIHELNQMYRGKDSVTDVITFALEDDDKVVTGGDIRILGDIYLSVERAREQANEYGHSFLREFCFLAVHGFYHLLGYDHMNKEDEEIMFQKQREVLDDYGIKR